MKLKDLPKYCESHYCYYKCRRGFTNYNDKPECEYQSMCSEYFYSMIPMYLSRFVNDIENNIKKDDEE